MEENELQQGGDLGFIYLNLQVEVLLNKNLDKFACILFGLIQFKDDPIKHCWASNSYFAHVLDVTNTTVSTAISLLEKEGYIERVSFDGRKRIIKIAENYIKDHKDILLHVSKRMTDFKDRLTLPLNNFKGRVKDNLKHNNNRIILKDEYLVSSKEETKEAAPLTTPVQETSSDKVPDKPILNRRKITLSPTPVTPKIDRTKMKADLIKNQSLPEETKPIIIPAQIQEVIEHWLSLGLKETIQTKAPSAYKNNISLTKTLLKKYSIDDVKQSITRFSIATFNENYLPINGKKEEYKKMHLSAFIKSSYKDKTGRLIETSLFQKYLSEEEPKLTTPLKENKFPSTVSTYSRRFQAEILGGTSTNITVDMTNKFITASEKLNEFWDKNKNRYHGHPSLSEVADWHFDAMKKCYNNDFTPGHLCTDNSMQRFAAYLIKERIFDDNTTTSVSTMGYADKRRNRQDEGRADWTL